MYNLLIGGAAGQGIDTMATIIRKILKNSGYNIFSTEDVMSRVRGGHNFSLIRFGVDEVHTHSNVLDGVIALNEDTIEIHKNKIKKNGFILCDSLISKNDSRIIKISMNEIANEIGNSKVAGIVAVGAIVKLFNMDFNSALEVLKNNISEQYLDQNIKAIEEGFNKVETKFPIIKGENDNKLLLSGNESLCLGAIAAGVRFYTAYPMSPATSIMNYLASKGDKAEIVVEQAEDEIAAINMAIGASFAGMRSMTGTSGGGFSLMVEALGLSGMAEIPVVIIDVQRPGPATGFPTRTEQSDLKFVISASHGEFPRMVIALRNHEDAFYQTARAFNIAEKYQIPVIVLSDQYLADSYSTVKPFDIEGTYVKTEQSVALDEEYLRYKYMEGGISPLLVPGKTDNFVAIDSDEHNERGWITESADVRVKMTDKRMKKLELLKDELQEPDFFGEESFEILLVGFGSTEGAIKEAVVKLNRESEYSFAALIFGDVYPLPQRLLKEKSLMAKKIINVEQNAMGQLASLIAEETGIKFSSSILKYDGRQITGLEIVKSVLKEAENEY